jgi:hypothetical protein
MTDAAAEPKNLDEFIDDILDIDPDAEIHNDPDNGQFIVWFNYAEHPETGEFVRLEVPSVDNEDVEPKEDSNEEDAA